MKSGFLLLITIFSAMWLNAQTYFAKTYGGENEETGIGLLELPDYSFLLLGNTGSFGQGSSDIYLLKTDSNGVELWSKTYGGPDADVAKAFLISKDNSIIIAGYTKSYGNADYNGYLIKLTQDGDTIWTRNYGGQDWDFIYALLELPDSGFALVGETYNRGSGMNDGWVVLTDKDGNQKWEGIYGGEGSDYFVAVRTLTDTSFAVLGNTNSNLSANFDIFCYQFLNNGSQLNNYVHPTPLIEEFAEDFQINVFGEYHIVGHVKPTSESLPEAMVYKFNPQFGFMYEVFYDVNDGLAGKLHGVTRISDDGYIYAGESEITLINDVRGQAVKTTYGGFFEWTRTFGNQPIDILNKCILTHDSCFAFIGSTQSFGPGIQSMLLWKIGKDGQTPNVVVVDIEEQSAASEHLNVYPNPAHDRIFVNFPEEAHKVYSIAVFDLSGRRLLKQQSNSGNTAIQIDSFYPGIYILEIELSEHIKQYTKFIKQ